ncbi:MAG: Ig-like domain-containing protein, partial [Candidatus Omnitrophica bacterium]|nr:Ig-like domain-containing protein [Candidatus Omnitrophota bacterium]
SLAPFSQSNFQIWQVEENRAAGTTAFYLNGALDVSRTPAMPADIVANVDPIYMGREIGGANNRRANMDLAEVLVYNRVLSDTERQSVFSYLSSKYNFVPPTVSVTSPAGGTSLAMPATFTLSADAAGVGADLQSVRFYANGSLIGTASALPYSVPVSLQSPGTVSLTAAATDARGLSATSAPVTISITGTVAAPPLTVNSGLQLWLKADTGVTADASSLVSGWADQSPNGNNAIQDNSLAIGTEDLRPTLVQNAQNGKPAIHFNAQAYNFMQIPNSPSLQPGSADWTVFFVAERGLNPAGDYPQIIGSRPWTNGVELGWSASYQASSGRVGSHFSDASKGHDVTDALSSSPISTGAYQVWQVEENRGQGFTRFYLTGRTNQTVLSTMPSDPINQLNDIFIGADVEGAGNRAADMNLAEVLVYNRALSDADRDSVTSYLLGKWALLQAFNENQAPTISLSGITNGTTLSAPATITLTATAADADGSIARVEFFKGSSSMGVVTTSPYTITASITSPGNQVLTAVATDNLGVQTTSDPVNIRVIAPNIKLMSKVEYSDTFTTNAIRTDGLYNDNTNGAYNIEDSHGNPSVTWTPINNFSFNTPTSSTAPAILSAAQGNTGANTGFAQSGGGDFSITYGLETNYVVQFDAILPSDRLDISSLPTAGANIFAANSLSIFLRRDSVTQYPGIGLFNGTKETGATNSSGALIKTGINDDNWHNFAINFDKENNLLKVYVDGVLLVTLDMTRFADGQYQNYSSGAVGMGGAGGVFWMDNFKVGPVQRLIAVGDYTDTFTLNSVRTDGLNGDNSQGAYNLEDLHGNPATTWTPQTPYTFVTPDTSSNPDLLNAATGDPGASSGLAQVTSYTDASFAYGLRDDYVVQVDAILPSDRLDIISGETPGGGIGGANTLSVFLRRDSTAGQPHAAFPDTGLPAIGLYNGSKETGVFDAENKFIYVGVDDNNWHRYAIHFDHPNNQVGIYVDGKLITTVDVSTFAGGIYMNYSNGAVGVGGGGAFWLDNFVVGGPEAMQEPPGELTISRDASNVVISWTGTGTLESAPSLDGPWTAVQNANNPYTTAITGNAQFYRLSQ